jgi:hypothetical protein
VTEMSGVEASIEPAESLCGFGAKWVVGSIYLCFLAPASVCVRREDTTSRTARSKSAG